MLTCIPLLWCSPALLFTLLTLLAVSLANLGKEYVAAGRQVYFYNQSAMLANGECLNLG